MTNRRRQRGEFHHQEVQGPRSQHRKPPNGRWQPTVPSWEKKFCSSVGSVPWGKLLETKRSMYLYENVVQWNDSAGEEAFNNAKSRYWAEMNGLPCNISLPDPDIYIDEIDWDSNVDPELLLDLEREPKDIDLVNKGEEVVILSSILNQSFSCTGWGDTEEDLQNAASSAMKPQHETYYQNVGNDKNSWECSDAQTDRALAHNKWGNYWEDSIGWNNNFHNENANYNSWEDTNFGTDGEWGTWNTSDKERNGAGWYMSRYKTSRFDGDDYHMDRGWWRNGRGRKRVNFVY